MSARTRVQTEVVVDGMSFVLASDENLEALESHVHDAVSAGGQFVEFALAGQRRARVFISRRSRIAFLIEPVDEDGERTTMSLNDAGNWDLL